ncbi:DUF3667 domain-containing protein [Qipengyuania sp. 6B39]|uniref:DUF3667 domain-containing protein n=1 Tax=Qipengyuania proteolytica TaxID=2867239 RepID=UPI001C89883B|nr:DUF3667 domain-containing protein [Qipengyuania proteolytica]MBX7497176.1 DUF3667 domain-containing protein [Qipengyuania proteolytica]
MSDFGEGLGTAVEGGLFARAVAKGSTDLPETAPLEKGHFAEGACLNCGTALVGAHCHACGQKAHLHRTMGAFMHDLMHGALHFEGKTWKTLPLLAFKPGQLTRRYVDGERARFVSPMALFLFSIFLMFAVFQMVGLTAPTEISSADGVQSGLKTMLADAEKERDTLSATLAGMEKGTPEYAQTERALKEAQETVAGIEETGKLVVRGGGSLKDAELGSTGWNFLDHAIEKWRTNPGLMVYKLQTNSYKFSWLLIPLSVPFMWLLFFWKRRFRAYDHAIFVTYSIAFMSLLFIVVSVLVKIGAPEWAWGTLIGLAPPIHIYKQLRGAYGLSRFSAFWRLCVLMVFIGIVLSLFLQLLLVLGAF